jgi:hypothetical protein
MPQATHRYHWFQSIIAMMTPCLSEYTADMATTTTSRSIHSVPLNGMGFGIGPFKTFQGKANTGW